MIEVTQLDGASMHLNEDLFERVEAAAGGQCVVYLISGAHVILAETPAGVVDKIRQEKTNLFRRVLESDVEAPVSNVSNLGEVRRR